MTYLRSLDRLLYKIEHGFLVVTLGVMVLLAFAQVVLRNVFGTGLVWGDTIIRHLVLWVGFFGAALATSEQRHISIDALTKFLSPHLKHVVFVLTSLFALVVCLFLAAAAWTYLGEERAHGGELVLSIPSWVAQLIIPIGYALMAVHFLVKVVENAFLALNRTMEAR
jgi:C4-dicarboxylate transporter, DctQ subunit